MSPEEAKKAKRKKIWRRVRRTCYVGAALMFIVPAVTFAVCYFTFEITPPAKTAREYNTSVVLKYSDGSLLGKVAPKEGKSRVLVQNLDEVSEDMVHATLAAESADFYSNPGFSVSGIARAVLSQVTGGQGGGSTITQQYVKLSTGNDAHSVWRKFTEVVRAFKMTNQYSKDTILKAYLNTAYYGRGAYGIHNAADAYFNKEPKDLNAAEASVLAGMVQLPTANDPRVNPEQGKARWEYVMGQMADNGWIRPEEEQTLRMPVTERRFAWTGDELTGPRYRLQQRVTAELTKLGYPRQRLTRQGLRVVTTIDKQAQQAALNAVEKVMAKQPDNLRPALVATDPKTGAVRAYYGGGRKAVAGTDWAATPQPPGSSFKPFVTMAGLKEGYGLGKVYDGSSPQMIAGTKYANANSVRCSTPKRCGVREATTKSVNTVFVNMAVKFGPGSVAEAAYDAGVPRKRANGDKTLAAPNGVIGAGIALGAYPVTPTNMANAYGALADGKRVEPRFVSKIVNGEGEVVEKFTPSPEPAFSQSASESKNYAALVTESMLNVAQHSELVFDQGRPVASKSGTHQYLDSGHNAKAWYVGYTPQISTAVSLAATQDRKPAPLYDANGGDVFGSDLPGQIWKTFMAEFHKGKPVKQFPTPDPIGQYRTPTPTPTQPSLPSAPPSSPSAPPSTTAPPTSSTEPSTPTEPSETTEPSEDCGGIFDPCDERPTEDNPGNGENGERPPGEQQPEAVGPTRPPPR